MTRNLGAIVLTFALCLAGCGGATTSTPTPGGAATTSPAGVATTPPAAAATTPPAGTTPQPQGGTTVSVTITGGPDAGSYTGSAAPNCSFGFGAPGTWVVAYDDSDSETGLTGLGVTAQPADTAGEFQFTASVLINNANVYYVGEGTTPPGVITITDTGSTATIHVVGPTIDGAAQIDLTVSCPSVLRA